VLSEDITSSYPIRFAVRSLGWVPIAEDQLTQENSSRAVNQCIVSLSSGLRDINDVVGKWGDVSYVVCGSQIPIPISFELHAILSA